MWACVWLPAKPSSPVNSMKDFITFPKLLAVSSAHHSVTGFMLPKHFLHCICYFSNGAPKIKKQSINVIRRLTWKQNTEKTGSSPTICLAAGAKSITLASPVALQLWMSDLHLTIGTCRSIFKKILFCWCEKWLYIWQSIWDCYVAKYCRKLNQVFSTGNFLTLSLQDSAYELIY